MVGKINALNLDVHLRHLEKPYCMTFHLYMGYLLIILGILKMDFSIMPHRQEITGVLVTVHFFLILLTRIIKQYQEWLETGGKMIRNPHHDWVKSSVHQDIPQDVLNQTQHVWEYTISTLHGTNSSHLKMDGWKTILSFWVPAYFQVLISFRECKYLRTVHLNLFQKQNSQQANKHSANILYL